MMWMRSIKDKGFISFEIALFIRFVQIRKFSDMSKMLALNLLYRKLSVRAETFVLLISSCFDRNL